MTKREFEATEGLLHDVMRKQAGTVEKAILEAVMNSVDAGAEKIIVNISNNSLQIIDDGKGMTKEEIEEYFQKFGLKDDDIDEKDFGKFRMGRGQIFNFGKNVWYSRDNMMVVDLNNDETEVEYEEETITLDSSGLSYNLLGNPVHEEGCRIAVHLYDPIGNVESTRGKVEELVKYIPWLHEVELVINGDEFYEVPDVHEETEEAYFVIGESGFRSRTEVYNQGAYVDDYSINNTGGVIIAKVDLDVNLARNDILDTDENWSRIKRDFNRKTADAIVERGQGQRKESQWLLEYAAEDDVVYDLIKDIAFIPDVDEGVHRLRALMDEEITFGSKGDRLAINAMKETGKPIIQSGFRSQLSLHLDDDQILDYEDVVKEEMRWEMKELDPEELSTKRRKNLERARWFLQSVGFDGQVKPGFSRHAQVWKDEVGDLYIHKEALNESKDVFVYHRLFECVEVASHDGSTIGGKQHNWNFKDNLWDYYQKIPDYLPMVVNNQTNAMEGI